MEDNNPTEVEAAALVIAVREMATDPRFERFMGYVQARMSQYIVDMGSHIVYNQPTELNNTAGRVDELRQLIDFVEDCRRD
jgi:hypothetical protein